MNREDITSDHRARVAYVYVRQSSLAQVAHHPESQRRQRQLLHRALELGWSQDRIVVVDEDLGHTAARSGQRSGFQQMVATAALGQVGIILALEVSHISRGSRDWYHLLDICAITKTLIADGEGLYDPRAYNDRLLLGLKGTMSEAELHLMKQRLVEAMRSKAARGEFRFRLPAGYEWDEAGRMVKDPDDQVRSTVELVFARFGELGTIHAVQAALAEEGASVPVRAGRGGTLRWAAPPYAWLHRVLTNPLYAGAYVYGKRQVEERLDAAQQPIKRMRRRSREQWPVLIRDHHEGYIGWETFERNQRQIVSDRRGGSGLGAPRAGESLLQGLVLCGRCGRRMKVAYNSRQRHLRYRCVSGRQQTGAPVCQSLGGGWLERAVEQVLLEALQPLGVEAMLEATAAHVQASEAEQARWRQQVERARYECELSRRQYEAVDPANRLVARELERRWEAALAALETVETQADARGRTLEQPLTAPQRPRLERYARDLPRLWRADTTRTEDRKRIARCLIEMVVVMAQSGGAYMEAVVHWKGGETTRIEVPRGRSGVHRYATEPQLVELVAELAREFSDEQIARILSRKRLQTSKGLPFTARRVTSLRATHDIAGTSKAKLQPQDVVTAEQAGAMLGVNHTTVVRWVESGLLQGTQATPGAPWRVQVTEQDRRRLTAADAPQGWLSLKAAAQALDVSQQTIVQRLKSGQLDGVRVRVGRRSGWRIRVPSTSCDRGPTLFD
jgi:DNA invertase Pin-like site-specific DNA recombinase